MCNQNLNGLYYFNCFSASIYKVNVFFPCIRCQVIAYQKVYALICPCHLALNYQWLDLGSLLWYVDCFNGSNLDHLLWLCPLILPLGLAMWLVLANGMMISKQIWAKAWQSTCIAFFLVPHLENMPTLTWWRRTSSFEVRPFKMNQPPANTPTDHRHMKELSQDQASLVQMIRN